MNKISDIKNTLPLHGKLGLLMGASIFVAILMLAVSLAGIIFTTAFYPSEEILQSFFPTDVSMLIIGAPMLLGALWLTRRGSLVGLLLWPGALLFVVYNYLVYLLALPLNPLFLLVLLLVAVSAYALAGLLMTIDSETLKIRLEGHVPTRLSGAILAGFGTLFVVRALSVLFAALAGSEPITDLEAALNTIDFLLSPAWIIGSIALWRRQAFGFLAGLGLLYQASMLFIGLIIFLLLQPTLTGAAFNLVDVLVVLAMGLICFIPFGIFLRRTAALAHPGTK